MTFEDALREQLESDPSLSRRGRLLLNLLNDDEPGRLAQGRKRRRIARMEAQTKAALNLKGQIDWADVTAGGDVDWKAIIEMVLKFLLALLPFILAL